MEVQRMPGQVIVAGVEREGGGIDTSQRTCEVPALRVDAELSGHSDQESFAVFGALRGVQRLLDGD